MKVRNVNAKQGKATLNHIRKYERNKKEKQDDKRNKGGRRQIKKRRTSGVNKFI